MQIHLGTDHAGFALKEVVRVHLEEAGYDVIDHGAYDLDSIDDYPDFVRPAAKAVSKSDGDDKAIIFGHSGQGEAMVANRFGGVRAAVYYGGEKDIIELSRLHNDANILSIGAGFISKDEATEAVNHWLNTEFSAANRHRRRITKIDSELN